MGDAFSWVTETRYRILERVEESPMHGILGSHVADDLDITASTAVRALKSLEENGLVEQYDTNAWDTTLDGSKVVEALEEIYERIDTDADGDM